MKKRGVGILAVPFLAATLFLTSCSDDSDESGATKDEQTTEEIPSPDPSTASPEPTASPDTFPSIEGKIESKERREEAEKFLRSYIKEINRSMQAGDISKLEEMADDQCELCEIEQGAAEVYEEGNKIEGGEWTPKDIKYRGTIEDLMTFEVGLHIAESDDVDPDGNSIKHYDGGESTHVYSISDRDGKWKVIGGDDISDVG